MEKNNKTIIEKDQMLKEWKNCEEIAEKMIPIIGKLYRNKNIIPHILGNSLINQNVINILQNHFIINKKNFDQKMNLKKLMKYSLLILESLEQLNLKTFKIDISKLIVSFLKKKSEKSVIDFVKTELKDSLNFSKDNDEQHFLKNIVLYGFGRIGRILARLLIRESSLLFPIRLKAIVVKKNGDDDLARRASLLQQDSVHGLFQANIQINKEKNILIVNGNIIHLIYSNSPDSINYNDYGIDKALIIDNTGLWRDEKLMSMHLKSRGAYKILLTAPAKGNIKNIVMGVNHHSIKEEDYLLSAASCTTNAIIPILKVVNTEFKINFGHVETVHAYTNDQNLIDNYHKKNRRGRSAALNMVITETGASKAIAKVLPELAGKFSSNAIRVPIPNVSMAILNLKLEKKIILSELNNFLNYVSFNSSLSEQISYSNSIEAVSSDFIGSPFAGIIDAPSNIVDKNKCIIYIWYDNEFGYSNQVFKLIQHICNVKYPNFPK